MYNSSPSHLYYVNYIRKLFYLFAQPRHPASEPTPSSSLAPPAREVYIYWNSVTTRSKSTVVKMSVHKSPSRIYLLDGGLGTTLQDNHSIVFDSSTPLWSSQLLLDSQSTLLAAQSSFADSGADVILTATYQASFEGFALSGVTDEEEAGRYMRDAVSIAKNSFNARAKSEDEGQVVLSLGAYGAIMIPGQEYTGRYDEKRATVEGLRQWHFSRIEAFFSHSNKESDQQKEKIECWNNVSLVAFETLPLLKEVEAVRKVMGDVSNLLKGDDQKGFWVTCVFPGEGNRLPDGSSVKEVVKKLLEKREGSAVPMGIGLNCTKILKVEELVLEFETAVRQMVNSGETDEWPALVLYPDGTNGEVYNTTTKVWEKKAEATEVSLLKLLVGFELILTYADRFHGMRLCLT